ncbi:hypothetical protein SELMODRAFT_418107 [Selaginella moellendorffii]|uniref:Late embryogenesis abundant protein LEA-2 subgroup domain-containing protein n=1 Tax=Selaginella moellendorffii TaxID=88036 RepID=D8S4P7_SELML|nr:hypothetical protein SELMODRAFT_418107 [Selaginella moellendorffii]
MAGDTDDMLSRSNEFDNHGVAFEEAWLLEQWQWHLPMLDFMLNPALSLFTLMAAISAVAERVRSLVPRNRELNRTDISRFFDEEYLARMEAKEARDRVRWSRSRHFGSILVGLLLFFLVLGLVMMGIYCYLKPSFPRLDVVTAKFSYINMNDVDASEIIAQQAEGKGMYFAAVYNYSIIYTLYLSNPNKRVDLYIQSLEIKPFYFGFLLGAGNSPPFVQLRSSSRLVFITVTDDGLQVPLTSNYSIKRDILRKALTFMIEMELKAKMSTVFGLTSPSFWCSAKCDIQVDQNGMVANKICSNKNTIAQFVHAI